MAAGDNTERRGAAITGLWNNSFFTLNKLSINWNLLTISTVKMRISQNKERQTREYFQILEENKFGENLRKIIFQTYFLCTKSCYKHLKGASAKILNLKIFSDYFLCQLVAPLFIKYAISFSQICFVSIAALLLHLNFGVYYQIRFILLKILVLDLPWSYNSSMDLLSWLCECFSKNK